MKLMCKLPSNIGGVVFEQIPYVDKIKWYLVVMVLYTCIIHVNMKYKEMLQSGVAVKYGSFHCLIKKYIKEICKYTLVISLINYSFVVKEVSVPEGIISILLISMNFIVKAVWIFYLTNRKNYMVIISFFVLAEAVCVEKAMFCIDFFEYSMFNRSNSVMEDGFNCIFVIAVELFSLFVLYLLSFSKMVRKGLIGV